MPKAPIGHRRGARSGNARSGNARSGDARSESARSEIGQFKGFFAFLTVAHLAVGCGARSSLEGPPGEGGSGGSASTTSQSTTGTTSQTDSTTSSTTSSSTTTSSTTSSSTTTSSTTSTTSSTSTSTTSTSTTTTTSSTTIVEAIGCADGFREGFLDIDKFPDIAGCSGGFQVAGLIGAVPLNCNHGGGDDGMNPKGQGCSATDLCAPGWSVCQSAAAVSTHSPNGCQGSVTTNEPLFFATLQSGTGCGVCATGTSTAQECDFCSCVQGCKQKDNIANDLFGCGSIGATPGDCGVLDRFSGDACTELGSPWQCSGDGCNEAQVATKPSAEGGGVLCCRD